MILNPIQEALLFINETFFDLYIIIVLFRFLLQFFKADYANPISNFVNKATTPLLRPLQQFIPSLGGIDLATIFLLIILQLLTFTIKILITGPLLVPSVTMFLGLSVLSIAQLIKLTCNLLIFCTFIISIISWMQSANSRYSPILILFKQITNPLLYVIRRRLTNIASIGGLDFSPMLLLCLLTLIKILIAGPIAQLASTIMV